MKIKNEYKWNLPKDCLLIIDEVHKCKNKNSQNGKMLLAIKEVKKCILLSATLADSNESFLIYGYLLNMYSKLAQGRSWLKNFISSKQTFNSIIYPMYGSRMIINDLKDKFPKNQITANSYTIDSKIEKTIDELFKYVDGKLKIITTEKLKIEEKGRILAKITKVRMKIERFKVPIFTELAKGFLDEGKSVIIFVNFIKTMFDLATALNTNCLINGIQTLKERENNIENFQNNSQKIIICIMKTGSQSINLHDLHGNHPRATLISPSFSSVDLTQALGRAYRSGAKTPVLQRIVFSANSCEQVISERLQEKLKFTGKINNEDLLL
jgi:superfamily II DNA or RNA helicase